MRFAPAVLATACCAIVTTSVPAQAAAYRIVGASCTTGRITSSLGPVPLSVIGVPRIGSTFSVVTEGSARYPWGNSRSVTLITGLSNTSASGVRLPFDITVLFPGQRYCGILRTSFQWLIAVPSVADYRTPARVTFTVPNMASLAGVKFYQQVMSTEFSTFGPPFRSGALSAGGDATIGF